MLKEYEQKVRKSDLEMESLNFRNQQLTKRIIVLQEELDKQAKQKHKGSGKNLTEATGDFFQSRNSVIDEELRSKIIENAQLLTTVLLYFLYLMMSLRDLTGYYFFNSCNLIDNLHRQTTCLLFHSNESCF